MDYDLIAYRALYTNLLGEHVGRKWDLSRAMVWTPAVPDAKRRNMRSAAEIGLYKVQGTTVEGIMGGIFHQFVSWFFSNGAISDWMVMVT